MVITPILPPLFNTSDVHNLPVEPSSVSSNSKRTDDGSHVTSGMYIMYTEPIKAHATVFIILFYKEVNEISDFTKNA